MSTYFLFRLLPLWSLGTHLMTAPFLNLSFVFFKIEPSLRKVFVVYGKAGRQEDTGENDQLVQKYLLHLFCNVSVALCLCFST